MMSTDCAVVAGQSVENTKQTQAHQSEQQAKPAIVLALEQIVCGVFAEWRIAVDNNTAKKVLANKGQCEDAFGQKANTMAVMFTPPASMRKRSDFEKAKKVTEIAGNVNRTFRLGDDAGAVNLRPFSSYLL